MLRRRCLLLRILIGVFGVLGRIRIGKAIVTHGRGRFKEGIMVRWEMKKWVYGEENAWVERLEKAKGAKGEEEKKVRE